MILVSVCDDKTFNLISVIDKVRNVRYHEIDTKHIIFGERQSAVHDDDTAFRLKGRYIHSDLFEASEWDDPYRLITLILFFLQLSVSPSFL